MGDKYLSNGAVLACTQSMNQRHLQGNHMRMFRQHDSSPYINASDAIPYENIPEFGVCTCPYRGMDDCFGNMDIIEKNGYLSQARK